MIKKQIVDIVVVTWNALEYTKITIDRIYKTVHRPFNLIIVDNGSAGSTKKYLKKLESGNENCLKIDIIFNKSNIGCGQAYQIGYEQSKKNKSEYILFCNNDLYFFDDNWLNIMLNSFAINENVAAVSPLRISEYTKYFNDINSSKSIFLQIPKNISPKKELELFFDNNIEENLKKIKQNNQIKIINKIPGSVPTFCLLVDKSAIDDVGFFADDIYTTYGSEDIDFCWELFKRGYSIVINNNAYVHHFRGRSIKENSLDKNQSLKNMTKIFYDKWSHEISEIIADDLFYNKFNDLDNENFSILRHMNISRTLIENRQPAKIFACFAGLGKTTCGKLDSVLDMESSNFRYIYDEVVDIEKIKGSDGRTKNWRFPNNFYSELIRNMYKYNIILIPLIPEIMHKLKEEKIEFSLIYPKKTRVNILRRDFLNRGNSRRFTEANINILKNQKEYQTLRASFRSSNFYLLEDEEYLSDFFDANFHDLINPPDSFSRFEYKNIKYVCEFRRIMCEVPNYNFSQVYCVGRIDNKIPIVKYEKGKDNLPGGTIESGEGIEDALRREIVEEINCDVVDWVPLGYDKNIGSDGSIYYQLRVFANLKSRGDFVEDIGGNVIGYDLINKNILAEIIKWGDTGKLLQEIVGIYFEG